MESSISARSRESSLFFFLHILIDDSLIAFLSVCYNIHLPHNIDKSHICRKHNNLPRVTPKLSTASLIRTPHSSNHLSKLTHIRSLCIPKHHRFSGSLIPSPSLIALTTCYVYASSFIYIYIYIVKNKNEHVFTTQQQQQQQQRRNPAMKFLINMLIGTIKLFVSVSYIISSIIISLSFFGCHRYQPRYNLNARRISRARNGTRADKKEIARVYIIMREVKAARA